MTIDLEKKLGLIAGNGQLPVIWAENAKKSGIEVIAISLSSDNRKLLGKCCQKVYDFGPGEITKISDTLQHEQIKQLTFIGKVHKGLVLKRPKFDAKAIELLKQAKRLNDDAIMMIYEMRYKRLNISYDEIIEAYKDLYPDFTNTYSYFLEKTKKAFDTPIEEFEYLFKKE